MPKLPQASGQRVVNLLLTLGYVVLRQRGSHVRLVRDSPPGQHNITVPLHRTLAKGTLSDIINRVSLWTGVSPQDLADKLK